MSRQKTLQWRAGVIAAVPLPAPGWVAAEAAQTPRLVLQITVDALRGDLPTRYANLFGDGGFRYLMHQGVHYSNAHYQHANTETIVVTAQRVTLRGAYHTDFLALPGGSLRYRFLAAPIRPVHVWSAHPLSGAVSAWR